MRFPTWPWAKKATTEDVLRELYYGSEVKSGVTVTSQTALEVTTVFRCACVISDCLATIPLRMFRKDPASGRRAPAEDHPLYEIFDVAPNDFQDSLQYRETLAIHLALVGNAYSFINRVRGQVRELIPIDPRKVRVKQNADFSLVYEVSTSDGVYREFPQEAIWHLRGPTWNGYTGLETVKQGKEAVGLSLALERSHARLHKNGVRSSGVYSVEGSLNDAQYKRLREYLTAELAGLDNNGKPVILDRAAKFLNTAITGVDAQHVETRDHQIEEICRLFGVLPIMVGYSDKTATYASAEQMFLAHAVHTARPWHRRFEASINKNLLTKRDRENGIYPKFIDAELLRGAAKDRAQYYQMGISAGWLTRNEAREWEELNPIDGLSEPLAPLNMTIGNPPEPGEPGTEEPGTDVSDNPKGE